MAKTKINKNQLANTFVESINEIKPDSTGDVLITNVATADNLTSPDNINDYGIFIFRTSAGTKSIATDKDSADPTYLSEATLMSIQGEIKNPRKDANNIVDNYIQSSTPRFTVTIDATTFGALSFVNHREGTHAYTFTYTGTQWDCTYVDDNTQTITVEDVDLVTAGITITPAKTEIEIATNDYITVNYTYETTTDPETGTESVSEYASGTYTTETKLVFAPTVEATFAQKVNEVIGDYTFNYNGNAWMLGDTLVDLAEYGISYTGIALEGDIFEVTYNGAMEVATPTSFVTSSFNQFNPDNKFTDCTIDTATGNIVSSVGNTVAFVHVVGGLKNAQAGTNRKGDYTIYDSNGTINLNGTVGIIGWTKTLDIEHPTSNTVFLNGQNNVSVVSDTEILPENKIQWASFDEDGYLCISLTNISALCVHPTWSNYMDTTYQEYIAPVTWENNPLVTVVGNDNSTPKRRKPSIINIPTQGINIDDATQTLVDINCKDYLARVGLVFDEIRFEDGKYINRIGRYTYSAENLTTVQELGVDYVYDSNYIYYVLPNPQTYNVTIDGNGKYMVCDFGTEEFMGTEVAVLGNFLYGNNLVDKLRTDVLTKSEQSLSQEQKEQVWKNLGTLPLYNYSVTVPSNANLVITLDDVHTLYDLTPDTDITSITIDDSHLSEKDNAWYTFYLHINMDNPTNTAYNFPWESTQNIKWGNTSPTMTAAVHYLLSFTKRKGGSVFVANQCYSWQEE